MFDAPPVLYVVMDEVLAGPHPDLRSHLDVQVSEAIGGYQPAIGRAACEMRVLGPEEGSPHRGMDAIGSHECIGFNVHTVDEFASTGPGGQPGASSGVRHATAPRAWRAPTLPTHRRGASGSGGTRKPLRSPPRRAKQRPPVIPSPLMPCEGFHAHLRQRFGKAERMQQARDIGTDLDARTDLAQHARLFVYVRIDARLEQRQTRRQTPPPPMTATEMSLRDMAYLPRCSFASQAYDAPVINSSQIRMLNSIDQHRQKGPHCYLRIVHHCPGPGHSGQFLSVGLVRAKSA